MNRPRYADVVATLALSLALGGTAYAAHALPKHSVGKQQLKPDAVASKKIKNGGVRVADLDSGSVGAAQLQDNVVATTKILNGTIAAADLAPASVGNSELTNNSVNSAKITNNSVTLDDLVGADANTTVSYALDSGACSTLSLVVPGAQPGQFGWLSLTGAVDTGDVVFGPLRVGTNSATTRACNVGADAVSAANVGLRVVTLG
jgi:hypothetical protein